MLAGKNKALYRNLLYSQNTLTKACSYLFAINNNRISRDGQLALWSAHIIKQIQQDIPKYDELNNLSLREKIIKSKLPFPEHTNKSMFDGNVEKQIKKIFTINEGIELPSFYKQSRFEQNTLNKTKKVTFYPTYSIAGKMFKELDQPFHYTLLHGRWGVGKSLNTILYSLLNNIVSDYIINSSQKSQIEQIKSILKVNNFTVLKCIYWAMNGKDDQVQVVKSFLKQIKQLWPTTFKQYKINENNLQEIIKNHKQQIKQKIKLIQGKYSDYDVKVKMLIDQINILASVKRKYKKIKQDQQSGRLNIETLNQSDRLFINKILSLNSNLTYLKQKYESIGQYIYFNSSAKLQQQLISRNADSLKVIKLGDNQTQARFVSLDFQKNIDQMPETKLQIAQIFIAVLREKLNKNEGNQQIQKDIQKIKNKFIQYDWTSFPSPLDIAKLQNSPILNNQNKTLVSMGTQIIEELNKIITNQFTKRIDHFLNRSNQVQFLQADSSSAQNKRFQIICQAYKQAILLQRQSIKNKKSYNSFRIKLPYIGEHDELITHSQITKQLDVNLNLFYFIERNQHIQIQCLLSPSKFIQLLESYIYNQDIENVKRSSRRKINMQSLSKSDDSIHYLGYYLEDCLKFLLRSKNYQFNILNKQKFKFDQTFDIVSNQNSHILNSTSWAQILQRLTNMMPNKCQIGFPGHKISSESNPDYDQLLKTNKNPVVEQSKGYFSYHFVVTRKKVKGKYLHFVDITMSKNKQQMSKKIKNSLKMLSQSDQYRSEYNSLKNKIKNILKNTHKTQQQKPILISMQKINKKSLKVSFSILNVMDKSKIISEKQVVDMLMKINQKQINKNKQHNDQTIQSTAQAYALIRLYISLGVKFYSLNFHDHNLILHDKNKNMETREKLAFWSFYNYNRFKTQNNK